VSGELKLTPELREGAEEALLKVAKQLYPGRRIVIRHRNDKPVGDARKDGVAPVPDAGYANLSQGPPVESAEGP
jgi:hypothetical protein